MLPSDIFAGSAFGSVFNAGVFAGGLFPGDLSAALDLTTRLIAVGTGISACELLVGRRHFGPQGIFAVGNLARLRRHPRLLFFLDRYLTGILILQAVASIVLLLSGPLTVIGRMAVLCTLISLTAVRYRRFSGGDGAEQFASLTLIAVALAVLPAPSEDRVKLAIFFIAGQLTLSYVTAGVAKLVSPIWRCGEALPLIMNTTGHGHPWAAAWLQRYGVLAMAGAWAVIVFECLFPALALGPSWLLLSTLAVGLTFHLSCAIFMGLNSFLWSFPASYPAFVVAIGLLHPRM